MIQNYKHLNILKFINCRFYSFKTKDQDNSISNENGIKAKYNGPKQYNIDSYLLRNKLLTDSASKDPKTYFERENDFFIRHAPKTVSFYSIPNDEKLHKKHEYYLNIAVKIHTGADRRKFEILEKKATKLKEKESKKLRIEQKKEMQVEEVKEDRKLKEPEEKVLAKEIKKEKEEKMLEGTEKKDRVKKSKKSAISKKPKEEEKEETTTETQTSSNEFKITEQVLKIIEKNKKEPSIKESVVNSQDSEKSEMKKILVQEEMVDRDKKIKRYLKFIEKYEINESFFVQELSKVPFLSNELIKQEPDLYSVSEMKSSKTLLFKKNNDSVYSDPYLPSVSNVIHLSSQLRESLLNWKVDKCIRLGLEGYKAYIKQIKLDGQKFHDYVEKRINKKPVEAYDENLLKLDKVFNDIDEVVLTESPVCHNNLFYHGRIDCLAYYKGSLCLIDWKYSEKSKPDTKDLYDSPVQVSAYIGAFLNDPRYAQLRQKHKLKRGLLVNFNKTNGEIDLHQINYQLAEFYWYKWLSFLREFWSVVKKG